MLVRYSAKLACAASAGLIAIFMIFFTTGGTAKNADFIIWLVPFMLGMIWSENKDKIAELKLSRKMWCLLFLAFFAMAFLRQLLHTYNFDAVIAIVMLALLLSVNFWKTGWIGKALEIYGKNSYLIFLFHGFFIKYFSQYVYALKLPLLVFCSFSIGCLVLAVAINKVKFKVERK